MLKKLIYFFYFKINRFLKLSLERAKHEVFLQIQEIKQNFDQKTQKQQNQIEFLEKEVLKRDFIEQQKEQQIKIL